MSLSESSSSHTAFAVGTKIVMLSMATQNYFDRSEKISVVVGRDKLDRSGSIYDDRPYPNEHLNFAIGKEDAGIAYARDRKSTRLNSSHW